MSILYGHADFTRKKYIIGKGLMRAKPGIES